MPNSVSKGFDTTMKTGSTRQFKRYPSTYRWVSSWLPFTIAYGLSCFILSKGKLTWHSPIGCGVSFESSWWAHFHGSAKTYAYWVWHSLHIGDLWRFKNLCLLSLVFIIDWRVVISRVNGTKVWITKLNLSYSNLYDPEVFRTNRYPFSSSSKQNSEGGRRRRRRRNRKRRRQRHKQLSRRRGG